MSVRLHAHCAWTQAASIKPIVMDGSELSNLTDPLLLLPIDTIETCGAAELGIFCVISHFALLACH